MQIAKLFVGCIHLILLMGCSRDRASLDEKSDGAVLIKKIKQLDVQLEKPMQGEWLYVNDEKGQTFEAYQAANPVRPDSQRHIIYVQPIGDFSPYKDSVISYTGIYLSVFFGLETKVLPVISDDVISKEHRRKLSDGTEQLLTTDILNYLRTAMPSDGIVMMAITSKDLYGGPQYNFVFGQARAKHRVAVSSLYRYSNGISDSTDFPIVLERLIKTSSHEIGHMFSCQHCVHAICVMNGSNSLAESDSRPNRLCSQCLQKLQWNLNLDVYQRQEALQGFFRSAGLEFDYELALRDLQAMQPK